MPLSFPVRDNYSVSPQYFNQAATQLPRFRAALANTDAGVATTIIACLGDSTTRGTTASGGTTQWQNGYPQRLSDLFKKAGYNSSCDSLFGNIASGSIPTFDSRCTITGTIGQSSNTVGGRLIGMTTTGTLKWQPITNVDTFEILWIQNSGTGTFSWAVDAGGTTNVSTAGAKAIGKTTISAGSVGSHSVTLAWVSGSLNILAIKAYNSTIKEVRVYNWGWPSSEAFTQWNVGDGLGTNPWQPIDAIPATQYDRPHLIIADLGLNDMNAARTTSQFYTAYKNILQACQQQSDVVLKSFTPTETTWASLQTQSDYIAIVKQLSLELNIPLIDANARFGSFSSGNTYGFYDSGAQVHLSIPGYADVARAVYKFIC